MPPKTGVLYPSSNATPLPASGSPNAPDHLIVIDGTWHQAKTLYRDMEWLREYPHYVLSPDAPSRYRIRREPKHDYISTLEALLLAIQHLEPTLTGVTQLLTAFDSMIDQQIECERGATSHRQRAPRRTRGHCRKPRALAEHFDDLVLVYAETVPIVKLTSDSPQATTMRLGAQTRRRLTYFCAHRLRDDSLFERWVGSTLAPVPESVLIATHAHGRAAGDQFVDLAEFERQWTRFVVPEDTFAAWGPNSLRFLPMAHQVPPGRSVLLKAAYGSLSPGQGALEHIIERGRLPTKAWPVPGRGGQRLSHARAVAELIHAHDGC